MHDAEKNTDIQGLLDGRHSTYGDRSVNMSAMGKMTNAYLDAVEVRTGKRELEPVDFPMVMALYKIYRFGVTPDYSDNSNDIKGYVDMAIELVGDKMIHAETAAEYQQKKLERDSDEAVDPQIEKDLDGVALAAELHLRRERAYNRIEEQADAEEAAQLKPTAGTVNPRSLDHLSPAQKIMAREMAALKSVPDNETPEKVLEDTVQEMFQAELDAQLHTKMEKMLDSNSGMLRSHKEIAELLASVAREYFVPLIDEKPRPFYIKENIKLREELARAQQKLIEKGMI